MLTEVAVAEVFNVNQLLFFRQLSSFHPDGVFFVETLLFKLSEASLFIGGFLLLFFFTLFALGLIIALVWGVILL